MTPSVVGGRLLPRPQLHRKSRAPRCTAPDLAPGRRQLLREGYQKHRYRPMPKQLKKFGHLKHLLQPMNCGSGPRAQAENPQPRERLPADRQGRRDW